MKATLAACGTFVLGTTGRLPSSWDRRLVSYGDILARLAENGRRTDLIVLDSHWSYWAARVDASSTPAPPPGHPMSRPRACRPEAFAAAVDACVLQR
jgi:hypothetical protein